MLKRKMMQSQPGRSCFSSFTEQMSQTLAAKFSLAVILAFIFATTLAAQDASTSGSSTAQSSAPSGSADNGDWVHQSLGQHAIQLGLLAGAGTGLGHSGGTQFGYAGGRGGIILSPEFLPGFLRGNFEWA